MLCPELAHFDGRFIFLGLKRTKLFFKKVIPDRAYKNLLIYNPDKKEYKYHYIGKMMELDKFLKQGKISKIIEK